nr:IS982 family transposase [Leptolyngbya sp. FACHB-321]
MLRRGLQQRDREGRLCLSEIMTILIGFHKQHYRTFKHYYLNHVCVYWREAFPQLVCYNRFVCWEPSALLPLCAYLKHCFGNCSGINFLDSTSLKVCHNRRIHCYRVFQGLAARGKTSVDWFFGFKLHLVVNDQGELLNIRLTPGNTDDRKSVSDLLKTLFGKVFADRGCVSQALFEHLLATYGIEVFAKLKRTMKPRLMRLIDKLWARKRAIIESIIDQLKNISQIEHSRHRSPVNFCVNLLCGLIAYYHQPKKPSLNLDDPLA